MNQKALIPRKPNMIWAIKKPNLPPQLSGTIRAEPGPSSAKEKLTRQNKRKTATKIPNTENISCLSEGRFCC